MSNQIQIYGLFLNLIAYFFMITPIFIFLFQKNIYKNTKILITYLCISILLETFISIFLHVFSRDFFSLFTQTSGIINYAIYSFKILFITSSLYGVKFLIPAYLWKTQKEHKKTAILVLSKIAVNIIFALFGYILFNTKGILYSFPICDLIYYIIYLKLFLNVIR